MKKLKKGAVENCIPTPSSCVEWNGGDIEYLGICNGDQLNNIIVEIVDKLGDIAGEDLSNFDLDSLLDICESQAPLETDLISILSILKENQICLKDYINTLNDKIIELGKTSSVKINLKCFASYDELGNSLSITRESLDQLVINQLCSHKGRLDTLEGKFITLQEEVSAIDPTANVEELSFSTCIDPVVKPTSTQVKANANAICNITTSLGTSQHIAAALAKTNPNFNTKFSTLQGWNLTPVNLSQSYGNLLLAFNNVLARLEYMENNCCALTCEDIKLGFTAVMNEDNDGIILRFSYGAGTVIPAGMFDKGTTGTVEDSEGNKQTFNITISNNAEEEVSVTGLNLDNELKININAKMGNDGLTCEKCLYKEIVVQTNCCTVTNHTAEDIIIFYETTNTQNSI